MGFPAKRECVMNNLPFFLGTVNLRVMSNTLLSATLLRSLASSTAPVGLAAYLAVVSWSAVAVESAAATAILDVFPPSVAEVPAADRGETTITLAVAGLSRGAGPPAGPCRLLQAPGGAGGADLFAPGAFRRERASVLPRRPQRPLPLERRGLAVRGG